jgi:hypothetical protein
MPSPALNYPSATRGDGRIEKRYSGCLEPGQRTFLISTHQATVPGDISRQHRRQSPLRRSMKASTFTTISIGKSPPEVKCPNGFMPLELAAAFARIRVA